MEGKTIKKVELRQKSIVFFFTDGSRFDFVLETPEGRSAYAYVAVARFNHKIVWTSDDWKKEAKE